MLKEDGQMQFLRILRSQILKCSKENYLRGPKGTASSQMWSSSSFLPKDPAEEGRRKEGFTNQEAAAHSVFWCDQTVGRDEGHISYIKKWTKQAKQGQFVWKHSTKMNVLVGWVLRLKQ